MICGNPLEQRELTVAVMTDKHYLVEHWTDTGRVVLETQLRKLAPRAHIVNKRVTDHSILVRSDRGKQEFDGSKDLNVDSSFLRSQVLKSQEVCNSLSLVLECKNIVRELSLHQLGVRVLDRWILDKGWPSLQRFPSRVVLSLAFYITLDQVVG